MFYRCNLSHRYIVGESTHRSHDRVPAHGESPYPSSADRLRSNPKECVVSGNRSNPSPKKKAGATSGAASTKGSGGGSSGGSGKGSSKRWGSLTPGARVLRVVKY